MTYDDGLRWTCVVALADPFSTVDLLTLVLLLSQYSALVYGGLPADVRPYKVPLHCLWTY